MFKLVGSPFATASGGSRHPAHRMCWMGGYFWSVNAPPSNSALAFVWKSADGLTWEPVVQVTSIAQDMAIWCDRWTPGDTGTRIHIAYQETTNDDVFYNYFDTATSTLGTAVTVFLGATFTFSGGSNISVFKTVGGNIIIAFDGDAGTEKGVYRSTDNGGSFGSRNDWTEGADYWWGFPGNYADNQDYDVIFWDRSADQLSLKVHDDSANTTSETTIASSMVDLISTTAGPQFMALVRPSDNHIILVAWNDRDTAGADLLCWDINGSGSIVAKTNVVTNSDDCQCVALYMDTVTEALYVFYLGKSDGSEVAGTNLSLCMKASTDGGSTWSAEKVLVEDTALGAAWAWISGPVMGEGPPRVVALVGATGVTPIQYCLAVDVPVIQPTCMLGVA